MEQLVGEDGSVIYRKLIKFIEQKHGYDTRDFANRLKLTKQYCNEHGIDFVEFHNKPFTKMNQNELAVLEKTRKIEYQDFWHWVSDNALTEINNGDSFDIEISPNVIASPETPEFAKTILTHIREELATIGKTDDIVGFYIDW